MDFERPNPDELLREVEEEASRAHRGRLTVFFGAAPGVGKTYAMLEAARAECNAGRSVLVGVVETHGRYDTAALILGLSVLPKKKIAYRGLTLEELDVDGILAAKPSLVLIDELAHTNVLGSRHAKRWQDVEEILDAGIDVFTTLNVQHLESLNDVVAQVTGVVVKETVPDSVLDRADDVRLVDLPPDELILRLSEGKVYIPDQAHRAKESFFRKGNLIALRELSLRRTAERVDAQMRSYKRAHGIARPWPVAERIVVCVSPSPASARLVRSARRMAAELHAEWLAVYVETPAALRMSASARERLAQNLRLAVELGGESVTLSGESAAEETLRYARSRNATKVVVGRPTHPRWRDLLQRSFLEEIVRGSHDVDVYVISGEGTDAPARAAPSPRRRTSPLGYGAAAGMVMLATVVNALVFGRSQLPDVVMVYLLGIVLVAMRFGMGPSFVATVLSVVTYDLFFVPPYFSFAVSDFRHTVTFAVMFFVAVVISSLTRRVREQADAARARERRASSLYAITRELATSGSRDALLAAAVRHVHDVFDAEVSVLLPRSHGKNAKTELETASTGDHAHAPDEKEHGVATWVWEHGRPAGLTTDTLPSSRALYVPLRTGRGTLGVLGVQPKHAEMLVDPDRRQLLETFAGQIAAALERTALAEEAQRIHLDMETERLRSSLLSSVSHDLRTPLGVVTGAASTLLSEDASLPEEARHDLVETIHEEAQRLSRLVQNLLDMTRLASGSMRVQRDWQPLDAVVGSALGRLEERLAKREVLVKVPRDLPLVAIDGVLIEQVFINLLENAAKYSPESAPLELEARAEGSSVVVEIRDRGQGIPPEDRDRVFEKFYRLPRERAGGGAGLGLAICRGIVEAHGGKIRALPRDGGGSIFVFDLPIVGVPPEVLG